MSYGQIFPYDRGFSQPRHKPTCAATASNLEIIQSRECKNKCVDQPRWGGGLLQKCSDGGVLAEP